ncbi:hypothetical protein A3F07_02160 [candidate division WWE3 bacterium RIFCSPHIGHO2_12_FULL_38_15]|uniref:Uncharacterized protein n=1 Tax=candidate division WWE3 bacterium RIFCSPHIGHO2_02_FULL_38_14 TaxID=1802620 RepID=A0A1F4V8I3_UNCKA|nr:MAG: hypothetical protein A2793_03395 [candidate division WWE3 bacterium RIFCSPHIGHO2_01_FULL_38_45]OGC48685.1 MAG: hypothetical protein A3F07_02160 [candidate division WWE3 bacterium RIFCSPHIGHO2_12_FULL_38_15]OGC53091.1 MAG: hypothetical protein A3B64_01420 [candidate division WWE3 bacterium RIFCSPLOWO2_01_FULL_37_24]OGC53454.1 MAG: hypothetical protein A3D91_00275 [candidate division WWE3 bacterium RIFCSPHIGHO2_02_FULL_38_14]
MSKKDKIDLQKSPVCCIYTDENGISCNYPSTRILNLEGKESRFCEFHYNIILMQMAVSKTIYLPAVSSILP